MLSLIATDYLKFISNQQHHQQLLTQVRLTIFKQTAKYTFQQARYLHTRQPQTIRHQQRTLTLRSKLWQTHLIFSANATQA